MFNQKSKISASLKSRSQVRSDWVMSVVMLINNNSSLKKGTRLGKPHVREASLSLLSA